MYQFSIRSLLLLVFVAAVFFGIAQTAGYVFSAGVLVAIAILVWAVVWRRRGRLIYVRIGLAAFGLVTLWFSAVDWSWFVAECPDCGYQGCIYQYRVFGMPVRTQVRDSPTVRQLILEDLGVPCEHEDCEPWQNLRCPGLVHPPWPPFTDILLVDNTDNYTDTIAAKVRRLGVEDPELAAQLHDTAVRKHDYLAFWETIEDLTGVSIRCEPSGPCNDP
jgi:hypothetical protein